MTNARLDGLNPHKFTLSVLGPEVWKQGIGRAMLPPKSLAKRKLPGFSQLLVTLALLGLW